jgi:hypothetical protein
MVVGDVGEKIWARDVTLGQVEFRCEAGRASMAVSCGRRAGVHAAASALKRTHKMPPSLPPGGQTHYQFCSARTYN